MTRQDAEKILFLEALALDRRDWDAWLNFYSEDCVFWMPAWRDETTPTTDPTSELSLIFYKGRRNLEDRVWRLKSGQSVASNPLPRTVHSITNVLIENENEQSVSVSASFSVHSHDPRSERTHCFFGRYEYGFSHSSEPQITSKKILLLNDVIPTVIDIYSI